MRIKLFAVFVVLLCSVGVATPSYFEYSSSWISYPYITNGLSTTDGYITPNLFYEDETLKMIRGGHDGVCYGYVFNGSYWIQNSSLVNGLPDVGYYSSPYIFEEDGILKMILSGRTGWLGGYNKTGGGWVSDPSVINGLSGSSFVLRVSGYTDDGIIKLITHGQGIDGCDGYYRNSGTWVSDDSLTVGLIPSGIYAGIDVLYDDDTLICLIGNWGYRLYNDVWVYDNSITNGLYPWDSAWVSPATYERNEILYCLMGDDNFHGYYLFSIGAPSGFDINGFVYNPINFTKISNATVRITQSGTEHSDITDINGVYNTSAFMIEYTVISNITKTNYTHEEWSFIPYIGETHYINQYMIPTNITFNGSGAIHGIITYDPYHQALNNATITITNATWSNITQSTELGYFFFENLTVSDYNISAQAAGYSTSENITVSVNGTTLQNINLEPKLTLTIVAKNADTLNLITDYSIILEGNTYDSVNGSLQIGNLNYGVKDLILVADGYYATEKVVYIDADTTTTILATQILGSGNYYAPHYVKFTIKSLLGTKYNDINVVVYLGGNASGTLTLNGTTGADGAVGFMLVENLEYTLTFINTTQGIDETITLYPVDNEYTVYTGIGNLINDLLNPDDEEQAITAIDVSVTKTIINDNTANITVNYNDIMDETSGLTLTLSQSIAGNTTNKTILSTVNLGTANNTAYNFTVTNYNGESYLIEIEAAHATHGEIYRMYGIQFENTDTLFGFTGEVVGWLAIIFLTWFALTATSVTVPHTAIGVCALATVMMAIGWGSYISVPGLGLAWIMAIGANMAHAKEASA